MCKRFENLSGERRCNARCKSILYSDSPRPRVHRSNRSAGVIWHGCCDLNAFVRRTFSTAGLFLLVLILAGCGDRFRRETHVDSEAVQEGSATGTTSTIAAPGEAAPPLAGTAPMTATNADTTTAFTILDSNVSTTATIDPGSLAGTLPLPDPRSTASRTPATPPPSAQSVISIERSVPPPTTTTTPGESVAASDSESAPQPAPEPAATAESEPAPTPSSSEPAEEESESPEPSPSPENTATSTASDLP